MASFGAPKKGKWDLGHQTPNSLLENAQAQGLGDYLQAVKDMVALGNQQADKIEWEVHQDILYRTIPTKGEGKKYQLVVPKSLVSHFLQYFHDNPLGAHLG